MFSRMGRRVVVGMGMHVFCEVGEFDVMRHQRFAASGLNQSMSVSLLCVSEAMSISKYGGDSFEHSSVLRPHITDAA